MKKMISLEILVVLLVFFRCIVMIPLDLGVCQSALVPCACGDTGISVHLTVKQCSHFYRWQHSCNFCDGFNKESFCTKFKYCLECNSHHQICSSCNRGHYGKLCTGICDCKNGGICDQKDGVCICPPKFEGKNCEIKKLATCEPPEKLSNGGMWGHGITEGSVVTYECNPGFTLYGQKQRTCTEDRIWTGTLPTCLHSCVKPEPRPNLIETFIDLHNNVVDSSLLGSPSSYPIKKIIYKCTNGFILVGEEIMVCRKNGRWNNRPPVCKAICPTLYPPINGKMIGKSFIEGDVVEFSCDSNFSLNGSSKSICLDDRTWTSVTPTCDQKIVCPILDLITDDEKVPCNKDYILKAVQNVNCKTKGRDVIGDIGQFIQIDCPPGCFGASNVIGTGIYSQNSLVCRAAIHIGKIPASGGTVYVINNGKFSPFVPSFLNGIQSLRTTKSADSFRFADYEKKQEVVHKEMSSCPFGWELFENICLHFPITNFKWNEAKVYCEDIQGQLIILLEEDDHFSLSAAMEVKGIPKVWIGLENKNEFSWIDGKLLINSDFDAWLQGEPQVNKTCVYTTTSGWATENCEMALPFACKFDKEDPKNNEMFCQDPSPLDNGVSSVDGLKSLVFSKGSIVSYSCNQYYYLQGSRHIHCLENGTWSKPNPRCQFVPSCPEPPKLANGKIDYLLPPETRQKRQVSRSRNTDLPVFIPNTDKTSENENTDLPVFIPNTDKTSENEYMIMNNTENMELIHDMESIDDMKSIDDMELIDNMDLSNRTDNDTFLFENETSIFRNDYGHLSGEKLPSMDFDPMTSRKESKVQSITYNFVIPPNRHPVGTRVQYACESDFYDLIGSRTATCQSNGKWIDHIRTCNPVCGKTYFSPPPLIINGTASNVGQWPWQAALLMKLPDTWEIVCSGSLLNNRWIVTAAQCVTILDTTTVFSTNQLLIQLGKHYPNGDDNYIQEFTAHRIILHPDYSPRTYDSDIALIELNVPVQFNHRVLPICLPSSGNQEISKRLQEGERGYVTGWGEITEEMNAEELHYAVIPVVSKQKCEIAYEEADMPFHITNKMYCAGYEEGLKDACNSDIGGPMVFQHRSSDKAVWLLEGILSVQSPNGCGLPNQYNIYTRVELFIDWIDNYIYKME